MTKEEAIKIIRKMLAYTDLTARANLNADMVSACNLAIKALEQEPCEDAISRQEVLYLIADYDLSMGQVVKGIHALPPVTPQEPRKGHWISTETKGVRYAFWCRYKCSLCGGLSDCTNFCSNCGARM